VSPRVDVLLTLGSFILIWCVAVGIKISFRRRGGGR